MTTALNNETIKLLISVMIIRSSHKIATGVKCMVLVKSLPSRRKIIVEWIINITRSLFILI